MVYREIDAKYWGYTDDKPCRGCTGCFSVGDSVVVGTPNKDGCPCAEHPERNEHLCMRCAKEKGTIW